jgi:hydrogenase nickel incorporation protein HypA/HybF
MHEVGLMQNILDVALGEAARNNATRIHVIRLRVGSFAGVIPDALEFAFESLSAGTIAAGASLVIEPVPAVCYCNACKTEFTAEAYSLQCPSCREYDVALRRGQELELASLEVS